MTVAQNLISDGHLLGAVGRPRSVSPTTGHAILDPRQLRRSGAAEGLRAGRGLGRDRRRHRPPARGFITDLPVVAPGVPARGRDHRGRAVRHQARPRRALPGRGRSISSERSSRSSAWGAGPGHPRVAGGGGWCPLALGAIGLASFGFWLVRRKRQGKPTLSIPICSDPRSSGSGSRRRCSSRSGSAAR